MGGLYGGDIWEGEGERLHIFSPFTLPFLCPSPPITVPSLSLFSAPVPPSQCLHSPSYMPQSPITKLLKYQISQIKINKAYL